MHHAENVSWPPSRSPVYVRRQHGGRRILTSFGVAPWHQSSHRTCFDRLDQSSPSTVRRAWSICHCSSIVTRPMCSPRRRTSTAPTCSTRTRVGWPLTTSSGRNDAARALVDECDRSWQEGVGLRDDTQSAAALFMSDAFRQAEFVDIAALHAQPRRCSIRSATARISAWSASSTSSAATSAASVRRSFRRAAAATSAARMAADRPSPVVSSWASARMARSSRRTEIAAAMPSNVSLDVIRAACVARPWGFTLATFAMDVLDRERGQVDGADFGRRVLPSFGVRAWHKNSHRTGSVPRRSR